MGVRECMQSFYDTRALLYGKGFHEKNYYALLDAIQELLRDEL
jgi:uncharacterized protein (UPF0332 family)